MLGAIALVLAAARFAAAQDTTTIVTSADETGGLLAYETVTRACQPPPLAPGEEPIFSIQTDTVVRSCTYVVNADVDTQIVSTIGTPPTATPDSTTSDEVPLSTIEGTVTETPSGPSPTVIIPIDTSPPTDAPTTVTLVSSTPPSDSSTSEAATTTVETTSSVTEDPAATSEPAETVPVSDGAAGRVALGGEVFGVVGLMAIIAAL